MKNNVWQPKEIRSKSTIKQLIEWALQYAILAPSAHNTQPWRWEINSNSLNIFRNVKFTLDSDPTLRETFLGIAAFIENFTLAIKSKSFNTTVILKATLNQDLHIASITVSRVSPTSKPTALFESIINRHTNRGKYKPRALREEVIKLIKDMSKDSLAKVFIITDQDSRGRIAELVQKGYEIALSMPEMQRELSDLISSEKEHKETGLMVEAMYSNINNIRSDKWMEDMPDPIKEAKDIGNKFANSPTLLVIGTQIDGPEAWIPAGRLMERILLVAASNKLTHDISAAPIEIPTLSPILRREISSDYRPQVLIRIGEPMDIKFTRFSVRRTVTTQPL